MYSVFVDIKIKNRKGFVKMELTQFLMLVGYFFILYQIVTLGLILFLLISFALTIVLSVLGYSNYLKEQEKNIILIKNIYIISILLGSFYFVSLFLKNIEIDIFTLMLYFTLFLFQTSLLSFLIAILSHIIKTDKHLNCLFLVISTMLLAFVYPIAIFVFVILDFVIRKVMLKSDIEKLKKMFFY